MKINMNEERIFTDRELEAMVVAVAKGQDTFTESDLMRVYDWMLKIKIDSAMVDLVLSGKLSIDVRGKDVVFQKAT